MNQTDKIQWRTIDKSRIMLIDDCQQIIGPIAFMRCSKDEEEVVADVRSPNAPTSPSGKPVGNFFWGGKRN